MDSVEQKRLKDQFATQLAARVATAQANEDGVKCRGCSMMRGLLRTCRYETNIADCPGQPAAVNELVLRYQQSRANPSGHRFGQRRKR